LDSECTPNTADIDEGALRVERGEGEVGFPFKEKKAGAMQKVCHYESSWKTAKGERPRRLGKRVQHPQATTAATILLLASIGETELGGKGKTCGLESMAAASRARSVAWRKTKSVGSETTNISDQEESAAL